MRYKLTLRWLGTHYCGWQVQPNAPTICGAVQDAVERLFGERGELTGCSRTDSGVHAVGFVAALKCEGCRIPPEALLRALNVNLPKEIAVTGCCAVEEDFHRGMMPWPSATATAGTKALSGIRSGRGWRYSCPGRWIPQP